MATDNDHLDIELQIHVGGSLVNFDPLVGTSRVCQSLACVWRSQFLRYETYRLFGASVWPPSFQADKSKCCELTQLSDRICLSGTIPHAQLQIQIRYLNVEAAFRPRTAQMIRIVSHEILQYIGFTRFHLARKYIKT
jgi:hypothetical protein